MSFAVSPRKITIFCLVVCLLTIPSRLSGKNDIVLPTWVCLKIGYIPNYSHLIGIMISKTIGFRGTLFSDTPTLVGSVFLVS